MSAFILAEEEQAAFRLGMRLAVGVTADDLVFLVEIQSVKSLWQRVTAKVLRPLTPMTWPPLAFEGQPLPIIKLENAVAPGEETLFNSYSPFEMQRAWRLFGTNRPGQQP